MLELSSSIKEDVKQINDVKVVLTESMNSEKVLLEDFLSDYKQNNDVIAENFEPKLNPETDYPINKIKQHLSLIESYVYIIRNVFSYCTFY